MATNKPTIEALREHIHDTIVSLENKKYKELKAWNRLLKFHLRQQSSQDGKYETDTYEYNPDTDEIIRRDSSGNIKFRY